MPSLPDLQGGGARFGSAPKTQRLAWTSGHGADPVEEDEGVEGAHRSSLEGAIRAVASGGRAEPRGEAVLLGDEVVVAVATSSGST
jgi:hypothetical protein